MSQDAKSNLNPFERYVQDVIANMNPQDREAYYQGTLSIAVPPVLPPRTPLRSVKNIKHRRVNLS